MNMQKPLIVFLAVVFVALSAPAVVASGGHRHHHNPPPSVPPESPPPSVVTSGGSDGHSVGEYLLGAGIVAGITCGICYATDGCRIPFTKRMFCEPAKTKIADPDPTRVTPDNTSGTGLRFGTKPLKP
jgi:hypothetical protein